MGLNIGMIVYNFVDQWNDGSWQACFNHQSLGFQGCLRYIYLSSWGKPPWWMIMGSAGWLQFVCEVGTTSMTMPCSKTYSGWWFGTFFIFPYIGKNHPNWLIFFRGSETTNQYSYFDFFLVYVMTIPSDLFSGQFSEKRSWHLQQTWWRRTNIGISPDLRMIWAGKPWTHRNTRENAWNSGGHMGI